MIQEGGITMRKRTINFCFDKILWGIIILLPLLLYFAYIFAHIGQTGSFNLQNIDQVLMNFGFITKDFFSLLESTLIGGYFFELFESGLIFTLTASPFLVWYLSYIIIVEFMHICVDLILMLPRICRKFMNRLGAED